MNKLHRWMALLLMALLFGCGGKADPDAANGEKAAGKGKTKSGPSKSATPPNFRNAYQFESVKIEFDYKGTMEGTETFYVADWGKTVVLVIDKKGHGQVESQTIIWRDGRNTQYNHVTKTIYTSRLRVQATEPPAIGRSSASQLAQVGYKKLADETIAGMTCAVFDHPKINVKYWVWKGMDLKIINRVGGQGYTREARKVEENITIPDNVLDARQATKKRAERRSVDRT